MYRNSEYYSCPTEGAAIAHVMSENWRAKKAARIQAAEIARQEAAERSRIKKERRKKAELARLERMEFTLVWERSQQDKVART